MCIRDSAYAVINVDVHNSLTRVSTSGDYERGRQGNRVSVLHEVTDAKV